MKKKYVILTVVLLSLTAVFLCSCVKGISLSEKWELLEEAYVYAFPLALTNATKIVSTNTVEPVVSRSPVNQFIHAVQLVDASFKTVVTPNVDTIYSQAWLDISDEPMIYTVPETDRFFNVQVLDAWTNTAAVLDTAGDYAITLTSWSGTLPEDVIRVNVPTSTVWTIARIVLSGESDLPNVYAIQDRMELVPLSAYGLEEYVAPQGSYDASNEFVPLQKVLSMGPKAFFDTVNALMTVNQPAAEDSELLSRLAKINVGSGMTFNASIFGDNVIEQWTKMLTQLKAKLTAKSVSYATRLGQWTFFGDPIGDFGTAYDYRTMVAMTGLGANTTDIAIYPKTSVDSTGAALTGEKTYTMHFDSFPPTLEGGFWSVTAYGSDNLLIDNPLDRYCINDRSSFVLNDDGSLDIILSKDQPENTDNWLPICDGTFQLFLRIYLPDLDAFFDWQMPVITANN